jgi:glyoxylase-like metal-dependent hydrolase (beta-lactamase superfamily II)
MSNGLAITALDCGWMRTQRRTLSQGGSTELFELPVAAYLIHHPAGNVVFDVGLDARLVASSDSLGAMAKLFEVIVASDGTIAPRLEQHDVDPNGALTVVLSHCHFDHCGGLAQLPNARVVVQADEWNAASGVGQVAGYDSELIDLGHDVTTVVGEHDLFGDGSIVCVPTPGHTCGHQSLLVATAGAPTLLTGDACYFKHTIDDEVLPPFGADLEQQLTSLRWIRGQRDAGTRIVPGHDGAVFRSLLSHASDH